MNARATATWFLLSSERNDTPDHGRPLLLLVQLTQANRGTDADTDPEGDACQEAYHSVQSTAPRCGRLPGHRRGYQLAHALTHAKQQPGAYGHRNDRFLFP